MSTLQKSVLVLLFVAPFKLIAVDKIFLMTHQDYPFHYTENSTIKGTVISELKCAFNRLSIPFHIKSGELWSNSLLLRDNKIDALVTTSQNQQYNEYSKASKTVGVKPVLWFNVGAPLPLANDLPNYKKYKVTAVYGSEEWYSLKELGYQIDYRPRTALEMFDLLLDGKVDAVASTEQQFSQYVIQTGDNGVKLTRSPYQNFDLKILFSLDFIHNNQTFLKQFNLAIDNCLLSSVGNN